MERICKRYNGSGILEGPTGQGACSFEILQLTTGRLRMRCRLERDRLVYDWVGKSVELRGQTDGQKVATRGAFVSAAQPISAGGEWVTELKLTCGQAKIGEPEGARTLRYGLTNLQLEGNEGYREDFADGRFRLRRQSRFSIGGCEVIIRSTPGSEELLEEVQATRGIGVSAEARVIARLEEREHMDELMDRLCLLLSLGLGRGIVWVYRESMDVDGHVVEALHRSATTKPWSNQALVPTAGIEDFVAATYPAFLAAYERWGLRNAIRAYNDALLEGDYLEFRALKMVVVMEYLKRRYCEGRGKMSFREAVAEMCSLVRVPLSEEELELLRDARNRLVHEATFLKESAAPSVHEQYLFLATVVGGILLAIVGYEGDWYDWRGASDGNGPRLTPFRLAPMV